MRDEAPFDLGVVGEQAAPGAPAAPELERGRAGRWVWAFVALAFAAGGVLGLVVADARDDTAGYSDVRLVIGTVRGLSEHADETAPGSAEVVLLNLGAHEVTVLGLELSGMSVQPDEDPGEPVAAPPGEWVTARQTGLIADCSLADPGGGVRVRVRDGGGTERVVDAGGLPDGTPVNGAWFSACHQPPEFTVDDPATVTHEGETLSMDLPMSNAGLSDLQVLEFEPDTPGLVAPAPEVPFDVPAGSAVDVPLTWTVTDCEAALEWPDVQILFDLSGDDGEMRGHHLLMGRARAELMLLVLRVCGDGG